MAAPEQLHSDDGNHLKSGGPATVVTSRVADDSVGCHPEASLILPADLETHARDNALGVLLAAVILLSIHVFGTTFEGQHGGGTYRVRETSVDTAPPAVFCPRQSGKRRPLRQRRPQATWNQRRQTSPVPSFLASRVQWGSQLILRHTN